ncbi:LCP family protein [Nonomuraea endophytica]|uniref:LCP family protein required for cell wall assembly n=1 Tax=Nonomuraea endophytica TaxID=714136 RepID=A0A7W8EHA0_9ACTN|nr:LCP family protein [Nonomuraea endophytica]MBB5079374.1 LCP family protein required for cell wall assembly [Nonomuraea endophytica]
MIGWTLLSVLVPGAAHLRAGKRRTGIVILTLYVLLLATLTTVVLVNGTQLAGLVADPSVVTGLIVGCVVGGLAWAAVVVASYVAMRPGSLPRRAQAATGAVAGVLAVAVAVPFTFVAATARTSNEAIDEVFKETASKPIDPKDPFDGRRRLNIALLGGDGAASRQGVGIRTDSINVVSIDVKTGDSVLFALPREMENAPFPPGSAMAKRFPPPKNFWLPPGQGRGSADLLNGVWAYADAHPEVAGHARTRAGDALKGALGQILGLKVDYYMMVNMWGVARLIDALGGVTIKVERDICYGVGRSDGGVVKAGTHKLNGEQALWYGRARDHPGSSCAGGDNSTRMKRQQCVMNAMLSQLQPANVLLKFNALARAAKSTFVTDIPRDLLGELVPLADRVKSGRVATMSFVPPAYNPAYPDFPRIRRAVRTATVGGITTKPTPSATSTPSAGVTKKPKPSGGVSKLASTCAA